MQSYKCVMELRKLLIWERRVGLLEYADNEMRLKERQEGCGIGTLGPWEEVGGGF